MGFKVFSSDQTFRNSFKKAKESEKDLLRYYKKYFKKHTKRLGGLYKNHVLNLKIVDSSMGSLNSMEKLFKENIPNSMKQKIVNDTQITDYLNKTNLKLKEYTINSSTSKMDFCQEHIKKQLNIILEDFFPKKYSEKIKYIEIVIKEQDSVYDDAMVDTSTVTSGRRTLFGFKTGFKTAGANFLNRNNLEAIAIFKFNDNRTFQAPLPHVGFKIDKERTYPIIKKLLDNSLNQPERIELRTFLKTQDKKIKKIIFEEQKQILEEQVKEIDEEKDNTKILMNIVKRIHKTQTDKSYMDDIVVGTGSRGNSGFGIGFNGARSQMGDDATNTLERRIERQLDNPIVELEAEKIQDDVEDLYGAPSAPEDVDLMEILADSSPIKGGGKQTKKQTKKLTKKQTKKQTKKRKRIYSKKPQKRKGIKNKYSKRK